MTEGRKIDTSLIPQQKEGLSKKLDTDIRRLVNQFPRQSPSLLSKENALDPETMKRKYEELKAHGYEVVAAYDQPGREENLRSYYEVLAKMKEAGKEIETTVGVNTVRLWAKK